MTTQEDKLKEEVVKELIEKGYHGLNRHSRETQPEGNQVCAW